MKTTHMRLVRPIVTEFHYSTYCVSSPKQIIKKIKANKISLFIHATPLILL